MNNPISVSAPTILAVILAVVFSGHTLVSAADASFETCSVPTSCGNQAVNYPFFLSHDICGFPGFNVSCPDGRTLTVNISGDAYVIHRINYTGNYFVVSNAAFPPVADPGACVAHVKRLYLTGTPYQLANSVSEEAVIFRGCNTTALGDDLWKYRIGCDAGAANTSVLAVPEDDRDRLRHAGYICGEEPGVAAPLGRPVEGVGTREVLSGGFELTWIASDCNWCNSTAGKCGYKYDTKHFQCFCPDRPHAARCDTPG